MLKGRKVADGVRLLVVPGSEPVRRQAEAEGLDKVFKDAGAEWRFAGCSMCLGMNPDQLKPGERCASTSNRNFEGRQGKGGRTHLVSPGDGRGRRGRRAISWISANWAEGGATDGSRSQTHRGIVATLDRANVDTDQIIPKQFLKSIKRTGFGESLFFDWRYRPDGSDDPTSS